MEGFWAEHGDATIVGIVALLAGGIIGAFLQGRSDDQLWSEYEEAVS